MAEYIEREVALNRLCQENCGHDYVKNKCKNCYTAAFVEYIPDAEVTPVEPELRKTVELLRKEYEKAKKNPIVRDPVAYALYQAWKAVDGSRKGGE